MAADEETSILARFTVESGPLPRFGVPVKVPLGGLARSPDLRRARLHQVLAGKHLPVAAQWVDGPDPALCFQLQDLERTGAQQVFEWREGSAHPQAQAGADASGVVVTEDPMAVSVSCDGRPVLTYRHGPSGLPPGVDPVYQRCGGYLHPLFSPGGTVLTQIQPPDHFHHYGVWSPWTHTEVEGRRVDFWNLAKGQGTVRSARILSTHSGPVCGGFTALLDHVLFLPDGSERPVLRELWSLEVWRPAQGSGCWTVDSTSTLSPLPEIPFRIRAYRYQGLTLRGRADWSPDCVRILTSAGRTQEDANGSRAEWVHLRAAAAPASGVCGILILGHPLNHDHPQSLRIWPPQENGGRDNVFINFNPAQESDWTLLPGRTHVLRYRMLIHDGDRPASWAAEQWHAHRSPMPVRLLPNP